MNNPTPSPKPVKAPNYFVLFLLPIVIGISSYMLCKLTSFLPEFAGLIGFFTALIFYIILGNIFFHQNAPCTQYKQFTFEEHKPLDPFNLSNPSGLYHNRHH